MSASAPILIYSSTMATVKVSANWRVGLSDFREMQLNYMNVYSTGSELIFIYYETAIVCITNYSSKLW